MTSLVVWRQGGLLSKIVEAEWNSGRWAQCSRGSNALHRCAKVLQVSEERCMMTYHLVHFDWRLRDFES